MGKKYSKVQWKAFYQNKILAKLLQKECPQSRPIVKKKDLRSLVAFFVMFAKELAIKLLVEDEKFYFAKVIKDSRKTLYNFD